MKENKLYSLLSKLSLYTSISVFIVVVMMALFFVLQVKFVLFGNFFSDILYSFHWLELSDNYVAPHFQNSFYILFYVCFIIKNIWILFLIYLFCLCTIIFYSAFNEKNNKKKITLVFEILLTCSFFVGYFPRSPLYSSKKLFIPSHCGLRVYDLDLDELVKKYAK